MVAVIRGNSERERGPVNRNLGGSVYRMWGVLNVGRGGSFVMKREVTLVSCFIFRRSNAPSPGEKLEKACSLLLVLGVGRGIQIFGF